ncbi:MAG: PorT family protein [Oligoflexia bacterium]|nr:PorT family protein [Oligoflexia bacterium]
MGRSLFFLCSLTVTLCVLTVSSAKAEGIKMSLGAGAQLSATTGSGGAGKNHFGMGALIEFPLEGQLGLESGILYSQRSLGENNKIDYTKHDYWTIQSVVVPVSARYHALDWLSAAGGVFLALPSSKLKYQIDETAQADVENTLYKQMFGLQGGLMASYEVIPTLSVFADARFYWFTGSAVSQGVSLAGIQLQL